MKTKRSCSLSRRDLLKTGLCYAAFALQPALCKAQSVDAAVLFQRMKTYRWLAEPVHQGHAHAPPLIKLKAQQSHDNNDTLLLFWMQATLTLIKKYRLNPLRAARVLASVAVGLHDTLVACNDIENVTVSQAAVAMHFTAGVLLDYFFPEEVTGRWTGEATMQAWRAGTEDAGTWQALWALADQVSQRVLTRALTDGSARINAMAQPPKTIALPWQAAPPLWSTRAVEPGAASWRHWLVPVAIAEQCAPPLTLNAPAYAREVDLVYHTHQHLTLTQKDVAQAWNLDLGTVTPPGVWVLNTLAHPAFASLSAIAQTSLLSLLTTVMVDTFSACWKLKFTWWTERPVTAIRRLLDPDFMPHLLTPAFPSFVSGHASVSAAAAGVLSTLLPQHAAYWQAEAEAAAASRLYGGIHFRFDNEEGLALGRKVATMAMATLSGCGAVC